MKISSILFILITFLSCSLLAKESLQLEHSDQFEIQYDNDKYVTYVVGNVHFLTETGDIYCDSARWVKGEDVQLNGSVVVDDEKYFMKADSVFYDMGKEEYLALGENVELWSYKDSVFATGNHAYFDEGGNFFQMENRPLMYLNYPDTTKMFEIIGDEINYNAITKEAEAYGNVKISSKEFSSISNCAKMKADGTIVDLYENPSITKGLSVITGELITLHMVNNQIDFIDVVDSARADFKEPVDSIKGFYDESILSGNRLVLNFHNGLMNNILCYGQAYSWYFPSSQGRIESQENAVSGDTIKFFIENEELQTIHVIGGSQGSFLSGKNQLIDSNVVLVVDTIDYNSNFIEYALKDSLISLKEKAHVKSGAVALDAHFIEFDTRQNIIEAFSADVEADTVVNPYFLSHKIQPNVIPVILKDGDEEILGDYLLYSIETDKGRIIQTKTDYTEGLYYGKRLFREQKDIYYVKEGRFTTCDADEPHFHFRSDNMKMIEGKRLIAQPVVFYIESLPILKLPYYVFPLEKGRHSGLLPFSFGKFERGERYVRNVGYYWAASEYMDIKSAFDYYEERRTINFYNIINFKKRYVLDGYIDGNYARTTRYDKIAAQEVKEPRWTISGKYSHIFSPTFNLNATGSFQSDSRYQSDFSQNIEERLNRSVRSTFKFTKRFSQTISLSGSASHTVQLDAESRADILPSLGLSLPAFYPFGSGKRGEEKFYNSIFVRYNPSFTHISNRATLSSVDTTIDLTDPLFPDTTLLYDSTRTRKRYAVMSHNPTLRLPQLRFGHVLNLNPSVSYKETWVKVYETDQSIDFNIDPSKVYRSYSYSANVSANTKLYGTLSPNLFGLLGIRHVLTPTASFVYKPQIDINNPEVKLYTGVGDVSSKSRSLSFGLGQLIQAKVKNGESEKVLDLVSISSGFNYNLEADTRPLGNLSTRFSSSALPIISSFSGNMSHTFYNLTDSTEQFWSPQLLSFSLNANFHIAGSKFFFDDVTEIPKGKKNASDLPKRNSAGSNWNFSADYKYSKSRVAEDWIKSSFVDFNLRFKLTPTTSINYRQRYDITKNITVNNRINITRPIHCWTGSMYWVPTGTNRGFGFKLNVTQLQEIKLDSGYGAFTTQSFNR